MTEIIKNVKNPLPFYFFEQISKIPRASGNEKEVANYIVEIAIKHSLQYYIDEHNNVLVTKSASVGRENEDAILLQAHTDMVAEKNVATKHDFKKDPIKLLQNGNILSASGTTLGADDGFGVSIMLAILTDESISHPKLECLFTSAEEIGLVGASKFDYSKISSKKMINLDSAEENTVIIGCCGGIRTELTIPVSFTNGNYNGYKITIGGLCGGHSGEDIDRGRLNAHILMGKALEFLKDASFCSISSIHGGDKDNAIPRECELVIVPDDISLVDKKISMLDSYLRSFVKANEDKGIFVKAEKVNVNSVMSKEATNKLLKTLSLPNGVLTYREVAPILPNTSRNLARIRTNKSNVSIGFSSRAYLEKDLMVSVNTLNNLAIEIGGTTFHHEKYPGWQGEPSSSLVTNWQKAYNKACQGVTMPTLIHVGLECGLITAGVSGLNAISVGCNVHDLHTPMETMEIDSMDRIYDTMIEFLKQ